MKKTIRILASLLCICLLTTVLLAITSSVLSRKDSINKNADFLSEKGEFDAMFFGSSHMLNGVFSMELWEDYGITSYNFAGHGSRIPTNYWIMKNALDYKTPRLVVIDCYYLSAEIKHDDIQEFVHMSVDAFPLTNTKYRMILDLFETDAERFSFLWPFSTYHNRWKELEKGDFKPQGSTEKGSSIRIGHMQLDKPESITQTDRYVGESQGVIYLKKMIEYCEQRGIEVILTYMPFIAADWAQREANRVHQIADEYGLLYLDYESLSARIDFNTDLSDTGHLNYMGGSKITSYIGKVITENYNITDKRTDPAYTSWHEDAKAYKAYKTSLLDSQKSAMMSMPLLFDTTRSFVLFYNAQSEHAGIERMLQGLGIPEETMQGGRSFLAFIDHKERACTVLAEEDKLQTRYGILTLQMDDTGTCAVLLNEQEQFVMTAENDVGLWVKMWDDSTEEMICVATFNQSGSR